MRNAYQRMKYNIYRVTPFLYSLAEKNKLPVKYVLSGGSAATVHFGLLYSLTEWGGLWYILSASIAFIFAFIISFCLQKFWTFRDNGSYKIKRQIGAYFGVGVFNLFLNGLGMYIVVDVFGVMYIAAQVMVGIILAGESFCIYRYIIFDKKRRWL